MSTAKRQNIALQIFSSRHTGYSFCDRLCNVVHKMFCQFISWTNWVNSGEFMENCWISCQVMADMENFYDDLRIINLYRFSSEQLKSSSTNRVFENNQTKISNLTRWKLIYKSFLYADFSALMSFELVFCTSIVSKISHMAMNSTQT